ncbi:MAG: substrate-binding domain-containing protein [Propionicimonas sp.]|uniref:substrate-binding domain-containing protein n=1 Tax=Propionicimonas sp. TaxID=1955623 RepID=UPI002B2192C4|nr:substrate-binding domain-containing protein [Propionicimonas sp.]MEA4944851.1 substrate-binding domain-containing protein [Propionicimonas sp.]MEA5055380.1 substrate-binding domain-containing protein [Propionicimonas sp.]
MRRPLTRLAAGLSAIALGATLVACTSGQETPTAAPAPSSDGTSSGAPASGPIEIALLQKQGDQQYFVDEADGAKAAAQEAGDVTITVADLGDDANKAVSEVESAIARGVKGIIIVVPDQAVGPQVIKLAQDAGIPIMAADDGIKDASGQAIPFTGFNGTDMGTKVGDEAARLYQAAGWAKEDTRILALWKQDLSVCTDRVEGAKAAFTKAVGDGNVPDIIEVGTDNTPTNAQDKTTATLTANSDVKHWVVWGCNDENVSGGVTALQNGGVKPADIIGVGLGAYLSCKDWAAGQDTGNKAALYISGIDVGKAAVTAMVAYLRDGTPLPPETIAQTYMVDATNYKETGVVCT